MTSCHDAPGQCTCVFLDLPLWLPHVAFLSLPFRYDHVFICIRIVYETISQQKRAFFAKMNSEIAANGEGGAGHPPSLHKYVATHARLGCLPSAHYSVPGITHAHAFSLLLASSNAQLDVISCDLDHIYTAVALPPPAALGSNLQLRDDIHRLSR
jgi:hypothetical protein